MTKNIQEAVCKWLAEHGDEAICENYGHSWEMDVASLSKSCFLWEFEVKISRSDFLADKRRKATKFAHYEMKNERTAPNYFCYVCPEGLIKESEIPSYAGLYYYSNEGLQIIKGCSRIHKAKANKEKVLKKMLRLNIQRKYLGGSMMTYLNNKSAELHKKYEAERQAEQAFNNSIFNEKQ